MYFNSLSYFLPHLASAYRFIVFTSILFVSFSPLFQATNEISMLKKIFRWEANRNARD